MSISTSAVNGAPAAQSLVGAIAQKHARATSPAGTVSDQVDLGELAVLLLQSKNAGAAAANVAQAAGQVSGSIVNVLG